MLKQDAVGDRRLRFRCRHLANWTKHSVVFDSGPYAPCILLRYVIATQANSASYPQRDGKWVLVKGLWSSAAGK